MLSKLKTITEQKNAVKRMEQLWFLRWNRDISSCLDALPEVMTYAKQKYEQPLLAIDARLWLGSMHRVRGQPMLFLENLKNLENEFTSDLLTLSRFFAFEKGVQAYLNEDYLKMLEYYVLFRMAARNPAEKACAMMNEIVCLDVLGFPYQSAIEKLDQLLIEVHGDAGKPLVDRVLPAPYSGVQTQRRFIEYSSQFKSGAVQWAWQELKSNRTFDQPRYFSLWCLSLPFIQSKNEIQIQQYLEASLVNSPHMFQRSYRIRTLLGQQSIDSSDQERFTEMTDRLYLWTWRYLMNPTSHQALLLLQVLGEVESYSQHRSITASVHEAWMIRNALSWITLLVPGLKSRLQGMLAQVKSYVQHQPHPIFEYEHLWLRLLETRLQNQPEVEAAVMDTLQRNPLHNTQSQYLNFSECIQKIQSLHAQQNEDRSIYTPIDLQVRLEQFLLITKTGQQVQSESLARAFAFLKQQTESTVSIEAFVQEVFGLRRYDEFVHQAKVFQCLARMKDLLPDAKKIAAVRGLQLHIDSKILESVEVIKGFIYSQVLRTSTAWFDTANSTSSSEYLISNPSKKSIPAQSEVAALAKLGIQFCRSQAEKVFNESRAGTVRRLNRWVQEGRVIRKGKGKSIIYEFKGAGYHESKK
jgi:hypothetical protein